MLPNMLSVHTRRKRETTSVPNKAKRTYIRDTLRCLITRQEIPPRCRHEGSADDVGEFIIDSPVTFVTFGNDERNNIDSVDNCDNLISGGGIIP